MPQSHISHSKAYANRRVYEISITAYDIPIRFDIKFAMQMTCSRFTKSFELALYVYLCIMYISFPLLEHNNCKLERNKWPEPGLMLQLSVLHSMHFFYPASFYCLGQKTRTEKMTVWGKKSKWHKRNFVRSQDKENMEQRNWREKENGGMAYMYLSCVAFAFIQLLWIVTVEKWP